MVREFVIDLFCGAGGTSTGIFLADCGSKVVFCVNHDKNAIESHRVNHPYAKHLIEDIRNPEVLFFLKLRINALRKLHPQCFITIWASLECTNFPEQDYYRVEFLRKLGCKPFVMPYNKSDAYQKAYTRYVNNRIIFNSCTWEEYKYNPNRSSERKEALAEKNYVV